MTEAVPTPYGEHLLPPNATPLQVALSGSDHRMLSLPTWVIRACWDPQTCPEHLLPYLAQAWSVDEWDPAWGEAQKRDAILASPGLHRIKGTRGAIERAMDALGFGAAVQEWFEYGGSPYRFRINITLQAGAAWTRSQIALVWRTAIATKNVRSWLENLRVSVPPAVNAPVYVGIVTHATYVLDLAIGPVTEVSGGDALLYIGSHAHSRILLDTVIT